MLIVDDGHIYDIVDTHIRHTLGNKGSGRAIHKNIIENTKKNNKKIFNIEECLELESINEEELKNIPEDIKNIFITGDNDLENLYIELWQIYNDKYKYKCASNLMIEMNLQNKTIYYNQDYREVLRMCEILDIPFENQSLKNIGFHIFNKVSDESLIDYSSSFNNETDNFFKCLVRTPWIKKYKYGNTFNIEEVNSLDENKCYSHKLSSDIDWMKFDCTDEVKNYNGEPIETNAFYYVNTTKEILFNKSGVYIGDIVKAGLRDNLITEDNIKYYIVANETVKTDFNKFVEFVYNECGDDAKKIINVFIGSVLGKTFKTVGKIRYTDNLNTASTAFFNKDNSAMVIIKGTNHDESKTLYAIDDTRIRRFQKENITLHAQIIQSARLDMYNCIIDNGINIKKDLISVSTDNIIFRGEIKIPLGLEMGQFKRQELTEEQLNKIIPNENIVSRKPFFRLKRKFKTIEIEDEFNMAEMVTKIVEAGNVIIEGRAGTGKSFVLNAICERLTGSNKVIKCCAFTHKASRNLPNGITLHKLFGIDIENNITSHTKFEKIDYIIVDEMSMINTFFYDNLVSLKRGYPNIKFILCGDFNQLPPVGEERINFKNKRVLFDICEYKLTIKVNKRVTDNGQEFYELMEKSLKGEQIILPSSSMKDINICYKNKTRKIINNVKMLENRGEDYITITKNEDEDEPNAQETYLYIGLPLLCKGRKLKNKELMKGELTNGDIVKIDSINKEHNSVTISRNDEMFIEIKINKNFINEFYPAYAYTIHSAQGDTIDEDYCIYDMEDFPSKKMLYTALSRARKMSQIFIGKF